MRRTILSFLAFFLLTSTIAVAQEYQTPSQKPATPPPADDTEKPKSEVGVRVVVDTEGKVIAASAIDGHPLLVAACVEAARETLFSPTLWEGKPVNIVGIIKYNFRAQ